MPVAPAEVQGISTHYTDVGDDRRIRNRFRFNRALACPLIDALGAWTRATKIGSSVTTLLTITPGNAQADIVFLLNLAGFD